MIQVNDQWAAADGSRSIEDANAVKMSSDVSLAISGEPAHPQA
jgi:hypothetical protein